MIGLLGRKLGMTHVYDQYGRRVAVTAVQAGPCTVVGIRSPERHGYHAVQVGFGAVKDKKLTKPLRGQFAAAKVEPRRHLAEFRLAAAGEWTVGQELTVSLFQQHELVDVTGVSIGKGFQGGIKRWRWSGGPATHGSMSHRAPGSIGSSTFPGRVVRGHHLPGHMGARRVTMENLRIAGIDAEANLLLVAGAVPGADESLVRIEKSTKRPGVVKAPQAAWQVTADEDDEAQKKAKAKKK